jgi:hypothetical protein
MSAIWSRLRSQTLAYGILDLALQTYGVLLQQRRCGVGVLRPETQLRRAVRRNLRRRNILDF